MIIRRTSEDPPPGMGDGSMLGGGEGRMRDGLVGRCARERERRRKRIDRGGRSMGSTVVKVGRRRGQ